MRLSNCQYKAIFIVRNFDKDLLIKSFKTLEKEMRFSRGFVTINASDDGVIITACARDVTSLRSLINGISKSLYLIFEVARLGVDT